MSTLWSFFQQKEDLSECYRHIRGHEYHDFACMYPALAWSYTSWETNYDPFYVKRFMDANPYFPFYMCILYAVMIVGGQAYFKNRPRWNWRYSMAFWNLGLAVFSCMGVFRTAPHLLHNILTDTLEDNLCLDPTRRYAGGTTGLWVQMFILSKIPELFDTFFIVIHKKKLIFLHWYHHVTVLLYCWHSYNTKAPSGIFFIVMNYAVHSMMYFYYFLMTMKWKPKWFKPIIITAAQISQMVVGVTVTLTAFYYYKTRPDCAIQPDNNTAAFVMYGSYLFLFLQFFIGRYIQPKVTFQKKAV